MPAGLSVGLLVGPSATHITPSYWNINFTSCCIQCFQLSPSIFLFPYVRKVFDLPKFTDTLVSYLARSGPGQYQLIDTFSIGPNTKAAILVTSQAQL